MSELALPAARRGRRQSVAVAVLVVLAVVTVWEALIALGVIPIGDEPGDDAFGADSARLAGLVALLAGVVVSSATIRRPEVLTRLVRLLLPLAGVAAVVALAYAFDPYYAPSEHRYIDGDIPQLGWLVFLAIAAVVAAFLTWADAHVGLGATVLVLLLCLGTFFFTGIGK